MDNRAKITSLNILKGCYGTYGIDNVDYSIESIFKHKFTKETESLVQGYFKENLAEEDFLSPEKRRDLFDGKPEKEVGLGQITPNQDFLYEKTVKKYQKKDDTKPVLIFQYGFKFILYDGHHRTCAKILNGCITINTRIIQLR
jgi:hypothetical protein